MSRSKVSIYAQDGILRLNFTHGKRYRFSLGFPDEPVYRLKAEQIKNQIELDILADNFDPTLDKYRGKPKPEIVVKKKKSNKPGYLYPPNPKRDPFTKEEINKILDALYNDTHVSKYSPVKHSFYAPYFHFMLLTSARPAEVLGIQWKHIHWDRNEIEISSVLARDGNKTSSKHRIRKLPKTGMKGIRHIPMNETIKTLLMSVKPVNPDPNGLVFKSPRGLTIDDHNLIRVWKKLLEKLNIPYRVPYALRHTRATNLIESGMPVNQVSYVLGHSNIKTTLDVYVSKRKPENLPEF